MERIKYYRIKCYHKKERLNYTNKLLFSISSIRCKFHQNEKGFANDIYVFDSQIIKLHINW